MNEILEMVLVFGGIGVGIVITLAMFFYVIPNVFRELKCDNNLKRGTKK